MPLRKQPKTQPREEKQKASIEKIREIGSIIKDVLSFFFTK